MNPNVEWALFLVESLARVAFLSLFVHCLVEDIFDDPCYCLSMSFKMRSNCLSVSLSCASLWENSCVVQSAGPLPRNLQHTLPNKECYVQAIKTWNKIYDVVSLWLIVRKFCLDQGMGYFQLCWGGGKQMYWGQGVGTGPRSLGWARRSRGGLMESCTCRHGGPPPQLTPYRADPPQLPHTHSWAFPPTGLIPCHVTVSRALGFYADEAHLSVFFWHTVFARI